MIFKKNKTSAVRINKRLLDFLATKGIGPQDLFDSALRKALEENKKELKEFLNLNTEDEDDRVVNKAFNFDV